MTDKEWTAYPLSLPPDYNQAIGEISARWSWLERQLGVIIRESLRLSKAHGYAITAKQSVRTGSALVMALSFGEFLKGDANLQQSMFALGKKLNNIGDMRNQYAHAHWGYASKDNPDLGIWKYTSPKEGQQPAWTIITLQKIRDDCEELSQLQSWAQRLTTDLKNALRNKST